MNHDKPYYSNISGVNRVDVYGQLLYLFVNKTSMGTRLYGICFKFLWFLLVAGVHLIEIP